jgi:hypothetical protein
MQKLEWWAGQPPHLSAALPMNPKPALDTSEDIILEMAVQITTETRRHRESGKEL